MKLRLQILFICGIPFIANAGHHELLSATHDASTGGREQLSSAADAVAVIEATDGNETSGYVYFTEMDAGVKISGRIEHLSPGKHGFHVHQFGDLRTRNGLSTGGHFNPMNQPHGAPNSTMRHVGDLGNIEANEDGVAEFTYVDQGISLHGPNSIVGRGLIIHAEEDDLQSQPTGAAGVRVGMAIIGYANPEVE